MTDAIGWVVPGPLRQVTGGYLYDARIVDGLRARGRSVGVVDVRGSRWPLDPAAGRRLARVLGGQRWGAVVVDELAHPALAAAGPGGRLRRMLGGAPLVLLVHHLRCSEPGPWAARALARSVETMAVRGADVIVCTSETTAQTVRALARPGAQIEVVRPGWDTHQTLTPRPTAYHGAPSSPRPRPHAGEGELADSLGEEVPARAARSLPLSRARERGAGGEGFRLLLVGHWTPRKGILEALDALSNVRPGVSLDLVGEQDRDATYAAQVWRALDDPDLKDRVRVHGRVPAEALARLFSEADALLLPSTHEGYGMVLAEALAAGLPIIANRVGAVPEVVRDGLEAELVPVGDTWAMARAIARLAADPVEWQRRAALARERAAGLPRWSESVAAFDALLGPLIASRRAGR